MPYSTCLDWFVLLTCSSAPRVACLESGWHAFAGPDAATRVRGERGRADEKSHSSSMLTVHIRYVYADSYSKELVHKSPVCCRRQGSTCDHKHARLQCSVGSWIRLDG